MALTEKKIGFIGTGKMGSAIIHGLTASNLIESSNIYASDIDEMALESIADKYGITPCTDNNEVVDRSDVIILAVKPQILDTVLLSIKNHVQARHLVTSIAAGTPIQFIAKHLPAGTKIIRVMPNITATVRAAPSALSIGSGVAQEDVQTAKHIFDSVGSTVIVPEDLMDAVTGLSGSGPAFVSVFIEAMTDAGVYCGLDRNTSLALAAQTVLGSAKMILETDIHPASLKDMVTSPAGTTIEGIRELEMNNVRAGVMKAVIAAVERSKELGANNK